MRPSSLRVLTYHRIAGSDGAPHGSPQVSATADGFREQMEYLARRYHVVSLDEVLEAQRGAARLPRRAVLLTFDDGYRDFGEVAWPILRELGFPATLFVPTAFPGAPSRSFWWDRLRHGLERTDRDRIRLPETGELVLGTPADRAAALRRCSARIKMMPYAAAMALVDRILDALDPGPLPPGDVLGWDELRDLSDEGVAVVPHTRNHAALNRLDPIAMEREIAGSLDDMAGEMGVVPPAFCYPYGIHDDAAVRVLAHHGVELAFTCLDGHNRLPSAKPLLLRRTEITSRTTTPIFKARLRRPFTYADRWRHRHKYGPNDVAVGLDDDERPGGDGPGETLKVAYIMSRFPKLSETFVLTELTALDSLGVGVELFPLLRERQPVSHPEAERWTRRARFKPFLSLEIIRANLHFLIRRPVTYLGTLAEVLGGTLGSTNFFVGAIGIFPKSVRFAYEMLSLDVTHVHAHFATHPTVAALIVRRLTGIPFSFTAHGSDLHVDRRMLCDKVAASRFVVSVSEFNKQVILEECGSHWSAKIHVLHCGVDPSFFAPGARQDTESLEIVCVASFEEVKGHRFLIEACRLLHDRGVELRCHFIGDGPLRAEVENQIATAGLENVVIVHGGLPRNAVAERLASADAAVLASHPTPDGKREGIPVALMEAMACELPVVATSISGIPELVEDEVSGLLVPSGDARALADALERLYRDRSLRLRLGTAAREKVEQEFNLNRSAQDLVSLIRAHSSDSSPVEEAAVT